MTTIPPIGNTPLPDGNLQNLFYPVANYVYFARAAEKPFAGADSVTKAAWAADAAVLCYARLGPDAMPQDTFVANLARGGLTLDMQIGDWAGHGTQGYFASNDEFAILAFRGTEAHDASDSATDIDLLLVHEPDYRPAALDPRPALRHLSLVENLFSEPCLVHQGFQRALNDVWADVHAAVTGYRQNHPEKEIVFTGHSLGAALAELAISRFRDPNLSLFTIGCPRVGNQAFCDRVLDGRGLDMFRCVNFNDAVAHVPLEGAFYRHAPRLRYRFDDQGNLTEDAEDKFLGDANALATAFENFPDHFGAGLDKIAAPPSVVDHSPSSYCIRLWNLV
jgi:hypothetical protein